MSAAFVNAVCAGFPGAEVSDPWGGGHFCWKVAGKMFAVTGAVDPSVSIKTSGVETADMLIEMGIARRARYMHASWVSLPLDTAEAELRARLEMSYDIIRAALPKKTQAALPPRT